MVAVVTYRVTPVEWTELRPSEYKELEQTLEDGHRDALDAAKDRPPPPTVEAYRQAYGDFPRGWPPWD